MKITIHEEGNKDMKKLLTAPDLAIAAAVAVVAVAPMAVAHADNSGSYTITLNGKQVAQGNNGQCETSGDYVSIWLSKQPDYVHAPWSAALRIDPGPKLYSNLTITDYTNPNIAKTIWQSDPPYNTPVPKTGNTYKVTGTVFDPSHNQHAPYEIDVTCP
jgi:hypothetical protein